MTGAVKAPARLSATGINVTLKRPPPPNSAASGFKTTEKQ